MMDAMALSSAACADRLGAPSEMPCTLCVRLAAPAPAPPAPAACGELATAGGLLSCVNAVHCLWFSSGR